MPTFGSVNTVFNYFGNHSPRVITHRFTAPAVGKRFVSVAAGGTMQVPNAAQTAAGAAATGVLSGDVTADDITAGDDRRAVWEESSGISVTAGAALTAGQPVESDAAGRAIPLAAGVRLGVCLEDTAAGADAPIKLEI